MAPPPKSLANLKRGGGVGRVGPNKATADIKAIATRLVSDPGYVESLKVRLKRGTAGPVEPLLFHYAYGRPKEEIALRVEDARNQSTADLAERARQLVERLGSTVAKRALEDV